MKTFGSFHRIVIFLFLFALVCVQQLFNQEMVNGIKHGHWKNYEIDYIDGEIAVILKPGITATDIGQVVVNHSLVISRGFDSLRYGRFKVPEGVDIFSVIRALENNPLIEAAEPMIIAHTDDEPNDPYFKGTSPATHRYQWGLLNSGQNPPGGAVGADIKITQAWAITKGTSNDKMAILDSGIPLNDVLPITLNHPDLSDASRFIVGPDYVWPYTGYPYYLVDNYNFPRDELYHGTHVTGIAAAKTDNGVGIAGVAWNCKVLIIQVFDKGGYGIAESFRDGVIYAVNWGAKVINYSGSQLVPSAVLQQGVEYAQSHDVLIVCTVGNGNGGPVKFPAAYSSSYCNVIAVGATDHNDLKSSYSNAGPQLDVMAPGGYGGALDDDDIFSTYPSYLLPPPIPLIPGYAHVWGTSMAAPMVTGVVSLMRSYYPTASASDIKDKIRYTADKVSGMNPFYRTDAYGYGRLNAFAALSTLQPSGLPTPPINVSASYLWNEANHEYHALISWQPDSWNESHGIYVKGYKIYRKVGSGPWLIREYFCHAATSWEDPDIAVGKPSLGYVQYYLKSFNIFGEESATASNTVSVLYNSVHPYKTVVRNSKEDTTPYEFSLANNTPNPFNPSTMISYTIPKAGHVNLEIYNTIGIQVAKLVDEVQEAGYRAIRFDAGDLPSGVYYYRLTASGFSMTKKLVLMK